MGCLTSKLDAAIICQKKRQPLSNLGQDMATFRPIIDLWLINDYKGLIHIKS